MHAQIDFDLAILLLCLMYEFKRHQIEAGTQTRVHIHTRMQGF